MMCSPIPVILAVVRNPGPSSTDEQASRIRLRRTGASRCSRAPCLMALFTASCAIWYRCVAAGDRHGSRTGARHSKRQETPKRSSTSAAHSSQRRHQSLGVGHHGQQPRASSRVLWMASFTSRTILAASASARAVSSASFASCTFAMKAMPVRCCPSPSCRSWPMRRCSRALISSSALSRCLRSVMSMPVAMM